MKVLRWSIQDYQESGMCITRSGSVVNVTVSLASFKTISTFSFPETATQYVTPNLHVYQSPTHDPIVLFAYPNSTLISMLNVIHLRPRKPPPFPLYAEGEHLAETTERVHLGDQGGSATIEVSPLISRWELRTVTSSNTPLQTDGLAETLMACAMGMGGQVIAAVGTRGSVWIWHERRYGKA